MIASLPMYDGPATAAANDRLWALVRAGLGTRGIAAPEALRREGSLVDHWLAPDLVLSQTCGLPFRAWLHGRVALVGTPDYGVEGCPPGHYRSVLVARADDPRRTAADFAGGPVAYNDAHSQSGWAALVAHHAALADGPLVETGSHAGSAAAVRSGRADIAALDAVTWALLSAAGGDAGLRVVERTAPAPGLPLIAAAGADADALFEAVAEAIAALAPDDRARLRLRGLVRIPAAAYLAMPTPPAPAQFARPA